MNDGKNLGNKRPRSVIGKFGKINSIIISRNIEQLILTKVTYKNQIDLIIN